MAKSVEASAKSLFKKIGDLQLMGWNSDRHEPNSWSAYGVSYDEISGEDHLFVAVRFDGEYKKYFVTHIALWSGAKRGGLTGWEPREMPATLARHSIKTALPLAQLLSGIISLLERGDAKMKRAAKYLQHGRSALREKEESGANEVENALEILRAEYKNPQKFDSEAKRLSKGLRVSEHAILFEKLFGRKIHAGGEKQSKAKLVYLIIRERRRRINFETANAKGHINMTTATPVKTAPKFKTKASMYETKPYYIIFAKTADGDWEQGFGDYDKNVVIQERKDEITRDKGYKTGPLDWFIADFDAPKRGGASQNVVDAFRNALVQGKFKIKADMLVGKARLLNVGTVYRKSEESSVKSNKKAKSAPALSPWEDNSPLDDVLIKSVASDDNPYKSNPKETAMEFKFELPFSNRMMEKLKMAEEPSFEDAGDDPKKRPLIALLKRSKGKDKLIFETVGEASDFLYAIASGLFGDEDWGDYNPAQGRAKEKAFPAVKAAMSKEQIAAVNKLRKNVWSAW
jgi:hypothetical protein